MIRMLAVALLLWFPAVPSVLAGPLDEAKAKAHLQAMAAGDLNAVLRDYADDAYMDWVGGPLDGRYRGKAAIAEVWKKFFAANGSKPRPAKFGKLEAYTHPSGTSIEVSAEFGGEKPVKVWHVFTYRDGQLTTEIWQVSPSIHISP